MSSEEQGYDEDTEQKQFIVRSILLGKQFYLEKYKRKLDDVEIQQK